MLEFEVVERANPWWRDPAARSLPKAPLFPYRDAFPVLWDSVTRRGPGRRAQVVLGPRQVGKSTLVRQILDAALDQALWPSRGILYVDFSSDLFARPPAIREVLEAWATPAQPDRPRLLLLDEVSQAPRWAQGLKALVDATRIGAAADTIIATDSSASLLRAGSAEHLEGRVDEHVLTGLVYSEFLNLAKRPEEDIEAFRMRLPVLERFLSLGGFPEHRFEDDPARARARIRSDVVEKAILRDLGREKVDVERARRLFIYLVRDSGAVFQAAKRARDLAGPDEDAPDARSVQEWVRLLEQASLIASLSPWSPATKRTAAKGQLAARPKIYAADHSLIAAFDPAPNPRERPEVEDKILETAIFTHLRALRNRAGSFQLGYLRDDLGGGDGEIDFVAEFPDRRVAIEVTNSTRVERKIRKVVPLARDAEADRLVIVHRGQTTGDSERESAVNLEEFFLDPRRFLGGDR